MVYFFVWPGGAHRAADTAPPAAPAAPLPPSIAVLPFLNMSPDKDQEYFSDGISEEILNALAQVEGLRVIGRTSSFSMKGRNEDLRAIGQRLNAANLLEGSVRRSGQRVRITAQLIEAAGGSHLWSQEFDRELTDVFAVQEEIARDVVAALRLKLLPAAGQPAPTVNADAHDLYLRGIALMARGSGEAFELAVEAFAKAVERDPTYALAWAALSRARFWAADQGTKLDPSTEWPKALQAAERAITLAPTLGEAYLARGGLRQAVKQDWAAAQIDLERARALSPGNSEVLMQYGSLLIAVGRLPEASAVLEQAVDRDPLNANSLVMFAVARLNAGRLAEAEAAAARALEVAPEHGRAARTLGFALLLQKKLPEARAAFHRSTNPLFSQMGDAMVDHAIGDAAASQKALQLMLAQPNAEGGAYQIAEVYAYRGEADRAFEWLGRATDAHDAGLLYLKLDPLFAGLRADPRWARLLTRLKLPPG
jgi:serine/threonine-protein kinase